MQLELAQALKEVMEEYFREVGKIQDFRHNLGDEPTTGLIVIDPNHAYICLGVLYERGDFDDFDIALDDIRVLRYGNDFMVF